LLRRLLRLEWLRELVLLWSYWRGKEVHFLSALHALLRWSLDRLRRRMARRSG
jgi:hypothetical protein